MQNFANVAVSTLENLSDDLLARVKGLQGITRDQLVALTERYEQPWSRICGILLLICTPDRIKKFSDANLREFLKLVNPGAFRETLKALACEDDWRQSQVCHISLSCGIG